MTESPAYPDSSPFEDEHSHHINSSVVDPKRPCDYCGDCTALLYCRADSAKLCLNCDREVHSANQLFSKHTRTQLCDVCDDSPATILCSTENSVFCQNCDWERHNLSLSPLHERRPIEGFTGCPSVAELLTTLGMEDLSKKALVLTDDGGCYNGETDGFIGSEFDGLSNLLDWDHAPPSILSLDDLIVSTNFCHNYNAMEVPPLPKNRKCGQHKKEILSQLRQLANNSEPRLNCRDENDRFLKDTQATFTANLQESNRCTSFERDSKADFLVSQELGELQYHIDNGEFGPHIFLPNAPLRSYPKESPDENHSNGNIGRQSQPPVNPQDILTDPKVAPYELSSQERDSAILRYKEKRKTRRYCITFLPKDNLTDLFLIVANTFFRTKAAISARRVVKIHTSPKLGGWFITHLS